MLGRRWVPCTRTRTLCSVRARCAAQLSRARVQPAARWLRAAVAHPTGPAPCPQQRKVHRRPYGLRLQHAGRPQQRGQRPAHVLPPHLGAQLYNACQGLVQTSGALAWADNCSPPPASNIRRQHRRAGVMQRLRPFARARLFLASLQRSCGLPTDPPHPPQTTAGMAAAMRVAGLPILSNAYMRPALAAMQIETTSA